MRTAINYQLTGIKRPLMIFYIVIYSIYLLTIILVNIPLYGENVSFMGGMENSSMIFIFILGLNLFKESFYMFLQNSRSRKQLFVSTIATITVTAGAMSLIDNVNALIASSISPYQSAFLQYYGTSVSGSAWVFTSFLWSTAIYAALGMIGYFITLGYYHMNKLAKILVSVGVPVFFFMILPIIDSIFTNGAIYRAIGKFILLIIGYHNGPYAVVLSCVTAFVLFGGLCWLMVRRATAKE